MNSEAQIIVNLFNQLDIAQAQALEAKDSGGEEKAQKHLKRVMEALHRTIIRSKEA